MRKEITLYAVRDKELKEILSENNALEDIEKGNVRCSCCNKAITLDDIGGIITRETGINVFCSSIECIEKIKDK